MMNESQLYNKALELHKNGDLAGAEQYYQQILAANPRYARAIHRMGVIANVHGDSAKAIELIKKAIRLEPEREAFHNNLGNAYKNMNNMKSALACYSESIRINPGYAGGYLNLAGLFCQMKQYNRAVQAYRKYLTIHPENVDAHLELVKIYKQVREYKGVLSHCQKILKLDPENGSALFDMGGLMMLWGQIDKAEEFYTKTLALKPEDPGIHNHLGMIEIKKRQYEKACEHFRTALQKDPENLKSHYELAKVSFEVCDWKEREENIKRIKHFMGAHMVGQKRAMLEPLSLTWLPTAQDLFLKIAEAYAGYFADSVKPLKEHLNFSFTRETPAEPDTNSKTNITLETSGKSNTDSQITAGAKSGIRKKLRIGYVSPDFRAHAVGLLIYKMFGYHNRENFEIFGYSLSTLPKDYYQKTVVEGCDHFTELPNSTNYEVVQKIYNDRIDILIDLAGYTTFCRTEIFALQPAPIQVQYLGLLNTMGAPYIQYTIADAIVMDKALSKNYTEKIVYLPPSFACFSELAIDKDPVKRSDYGLPENGTIYCCFNRAYKIDPDVFSVWMRILKKVPGSVLWIYDSTGPPLDTNLRREAANRGVDKERIIFAPMVPIEKHLARCSLGDLFLDSFQYNGGTTCLLSLWAGLPVLTCPGDSFLSRMGASFLTAAELPELIAKSSGEYEETAVALAGDPDRLQELKERLCKGRQKLPLFDTGRFVANLERAYFKMWDNYQHNRHEDIHI